MAVFKCKMCGATLNGDEGTSVVTCEYCGTKQTVSLSDDEKRVNLYNRANRLRLANEYDKAAALYESIVAEFSEEAEAYWGLVLCHYGIEYVDDPATAFKIPTCHRASFDSVLQNENYQMALENADVAAQKVYRDQARELERIRTEILAISQNETPYDIFICYKETDSNGERTIDSVIAQNVYDTLTEKGYKVFFSRISLEDKLGQQYEPFIFAALNSAKIMLAFGTQYEYYHAVWVKNEWNRFLKLMAKDKSKVLIPCYKDIDAYDMPEEFKPLQAQDMGKVGSTQDLLQAIERLLGGSKAPLVAPVPTPTITPPLSPPLETPFKRPSPTPFTPVAPSNETIYNRAKQKISLRTVEGYREAIALLEPISQWKDAGQLIDFCDAQIDKIVEARKQKIQQEKQEQENYANLKQKRAKIKKFAIPIAIVAIILTVVILWNPVIYPYTHYNDATRFFKNGEYAEAYRCFRSLEDYKDSKTQMIRTVKTAFEKAEVGDIVSFGLYPSRGTGDYYDLVDWRVLAKEDDKVFVVSAYLLENWYFSSETENNVKWETNEVRTHLNTTFYNTAFTAEEQEIIESTTIWNSDNAADCTTDKLFLLSIEEAKYYFKNDQDRKATYDEHNNYYHIWGLRSLGDSLDYNAYVSENGEIIKNEKRIDYDKSVENDFAIRPAMWIDIG